MEDPATTEELGTIPEMGLAETKEAIDAAAEAFRTWGKTTAKVRILLSVSVLWERGVDGVVCRSATTSS